MTVERWTDEMLDRLATSIAENSRLIAESRELIDRNGEQIARNSEQINELRVNQAMLQQEQSDASRQFMHTIGVISQQQGETDDLRTETNRMLDILINQR
jgi:FKBP-type peptidyl-prolyl cis-trans isomerase (trigger factor)